jgi:hypothetical protein
MSCYICGRGACTPSFHSIDEQEAFEPAEEAYEHFLNVRDRCREKYEEEENE